MKQKHALVVLFLVVALIALYIFFRTEVKEPKVSSFEECSAAGYPVMESYPRQCRDAAGNNFVEDVTAEWEVSYTNAGPDLIRTVSVEAGDAIVSPLTIEGEARGYWFFEASFPVTLVDWDGRIVAEHYAEAVLNPDDPESTWMTEDFVPFKATVTFDAPLGPGGPLNRGALILHRDNPSGLPENDAALEIPIVFE